MNKYGARIVACALAGTLSLSGYQTTLAAKMQNTVTDGDSIWGSPIVAPKNTVSAVLKSFGEDESEIMDESYESETELPTEPVTDDMEDDNLNTSAGFNPLELINVSGENEENGEVTELETESDSSYSDATESDSEEQDFSGLVIAKASGYVNVRSIPSEDGDVIGKLYDKSVGELIEEVDGWYKIVSGNCTGYVKAEYCITGSEAEELAKEVGTTYAIVNTTTLKVREEASTDSSVLGLVPLNEELLVVEELDGWVKISIEEGDGYVSREYVYLRTDFVTAESKEEEEARLAKEASERQAAREAAAQTQTQQVTETVIPKTESVQAVIETANAAAESSEGSEIGKAVVEFATQFVGNPYVYGGTSLTNGADCSGFVMSVYANFGVSLPHSSSSLRSVGTNVGTSLADAQPGDIICYSGHCGIYVGNGLLVHASNSRDGIKVSSASYRQILAIRRIF